MKIATWNIYWLGDNGQHIVRTQKDEQVRTSALQTIEDHRGKQNDYYLFLCEPLCWHCG
jgi:hypothetical protein